MILDDDLLRELQAIFAVEAQDHLQALSQHLLTLEQQPQPPVSDQLLAEIFREAHTLKGAARSVNLEPVEALSHRLESLFSLVQCGALSPRAELFDLVYQVLDAIGVLVHASAAGASASVDVQALCARLERMAEPPASAGAPVAAATLPTSKPRQVRARPRRASPIQAEPVAPPGAPAPAPLAEAALRPIDETVRVATAKLDALMAQVGELQVTRIGTAQRMVELRGLREQVEVWDAAWRKLRPHYRRLRQAAGAERSPVRASMAHDQAAPGQASAIDARGLSALLGFLETNEAQLRMVRAQLGDLGRAFEADSRRLAQVTADLQDDVRHVRMLPISTVFDAFPRMVRDLARERDKDIRLVIEGGETEVDRSMIEQIKAPLMHLLRNCVDHGIEAPQARLAAGKTGAGTITLAAAQRAGSIVIDVADDGGGIDLARVRASSVAQGLLSADAAEALSDREALWLIFRSGLSTSPAITDISGRGVGMDVVREHIERSNGMIDVESQPGQGTHFTLTLPLTVATTLCLLVRAAGQTMALPITNVVRMLRLAPEQIGRADGREGMLVDGRPVALARLADVLALEPAQAPADAPARLSVIILGAAEKRVAFVVDALAGAQEVVIKRLPRPLDRVACTAGATILGTGQVVMILNVADLLRAAALTGSAAGAPLIAATSELQRPTILVADDSITTRTMEKNILQAAGYLVHVAADGRDAWSFLQANHVDLLVSDVNMPHLDGFGLAERVRADARLKRLPIILVTSLDSAADRERGVAAGADAYIVKAAFDQATLLTSIRQFL